MLEFLPAINIYGTSKWLLNSKNGDNKGKERFDEQLIKRVTCTNEMEYLAGTYGGGVCNI